MINLLELEKKSEAAALELIKIGKLQQKQILVIGCSTSEVGGHAIGSTSSVEIAEALYKGLSKAANVVGIYLAFQCCEHLNRAIVVEREAVPFAEIVNVVPQVKAGGSMATTAYNHMTNPVVLENIKADAGIDIGDTFIGMHLKAVAVPVRLKIKEIGEAHVTAARVRPKFIGGSRAVYDEALAEPGK